MLITRDRVDDEVFAVELVLNEEDKRKVISNLQTIKLGLKEETDPLEFHSLWDTIQHIGGLGRWVQHTV